jgi:RNA-directed DNA polymerase
MRCKQAAEAFLQGIGLELRPEKTRIAHTLEKLGEEKPGFNFLGFNVRQYLVGKHQSKQGFKTLIKPQKEKIQAHHRKLAGIIVEMRATPQEALIKRLNPIIKAGQTTTAHR